MSTAAAPSIEALLSAEEYACLVPDDRPSELILGRVVERDPPFSVHGYWCAQSAGVLQDYAEKHQLGRLATNYPGVITTRDPDTVRGPDIGYYSFLRVSGDRFPEGFWPTPDMVLEVGSTPALLSAAHEKVGEYLAAGVNCVVVLDPPTRSVQVYSADHPVVILQEADTLTLPDVLPGFSVPVRQLYE